MHSDYREGTFSPTSTRNSLLSDSIVIEPLSSALDRSLFMGVDSISVRNSSHFRLCGEENIINRDRGNTDTTQRNSHSGKPNEEEETRLKKVSKLCYEECKSINGVNIHLARIRVEHLKGVCERRKKLLDELRAKVKDLLSDSPSILEKENIPGGIVPKSKYGNFKMP
ncbi:hypothetical protein AX774_g7028 [Zancudomyces culisetae]|uniref:Uncharacterized protein n=1 Tax=Zancudomyces culisetae TaxID=1213189 RepID=A0A1R1PF73_ZANCU|nr:hypothetical protein AX774_g7028 [Zancudomyces culisetae]|eukprot:OMH79553.1 hypothetical protein AX774_g7028 [Zancudomyces culisetae]